MAAAIYLYTGPEAGERNDAVNNIIVSLKKKFGNIEEYHYYATETSVADFISVLENESLFASAVCVTIKNAEAIKKKEDVETITKWISSSKSDSNVLILTSDEISIDSKIEKAVPAANKKIFWEMFENQKVPWIFNFFRKNGYLIEQEAAEDILEMVENNTEVLKNECSRFFILFPKEHKITQEDVESVLTHTREENSFTLFESMAENAESQNKRFEKSIDILQKIRLSKENSSVLIIAGLTSCFRKLLLWHKLEVQGQNDDFNLKINGFGSKKLKAQYAKAAKIWSSGQTTAILADLANSDMEIRSGGNLLEDVILEKLLYEIVIKKGASCAKYEF